MLKENTKVKKKKKNMQVCPVSFMCNVEPVSFV